MEHAMRPFWNGSVIRLDFQHCLDDGCALRHLLLVSLFCSRTISRAHCKSGHGSLVAVAQYRKREAKMRVIAKEVATVGNSREAAHVAEVDMKMVHGALTWTTAPVRVLEKMGGDLRYLLWWKAMRCSAMATAEERE